VQHEAREWAKRELLKNPPDRSKIDWEVVGRGFGVTFKPTPAPAGKGRTSETPGSLTA
jgi:hypothetical protein